MNHSIIHRWLLTLVIALGIMVTAIPEAEARRIGVWHSDVSRPPAYLKREVIATIQSVLEEWEQHTYGGRMIFEWQGEVAGSLPPANNSTIVFYWDPNIDPTRCASTCRFGTFGCSGVDIGRVRLNPWMNVWVNGNQTGTMVNDPTWDTTTFSSCSLRATLMHELGHLILDTGAHPWNSVLRDPASSLTGRHLWRDDVLPSNNWFLPNHDRAIMIETVSRSAVVSAGVVSDTLPSTSRVISPVALAMGDGRPAGSVNANYAAVYGGEDIATSRLGLFFLLGDGRQWPFTQQFLCESSTTCANHQATYRRPCVVNSHDGDHYYIVWAEDFQQSDGSRWVWYKESHDAGGTWSAAATLPWAVTRAGVSCTLDPHRDRVVVAYSGANDDGIYLADRSATAVGSGAWTMPRMIQNEGGLPVAPRTADVPYVVFDQFGGNTPGRMAWRDDLELTPKIATIFFDGTRYTIGNPRAIWDSYDTGALSGFTTAERLRSIPVIDFEGFPVLALSLNRYLAQQRQHWQWDLDQAPPQQANSIEYNSITDAVIRRYTGAASNRDIPETALVSTTLRNPN